MLSALDEAALARRREAAADDALGVSMEQQRVVALTSPHVRHVDAHTSLAAARFSPHLSTPHATALPPVSPAYASLPTYHQRQSPAPLCARIFARLVEVGIFQPQENQPAAAAEAHAVLAGDHAAAGHAAE